MIGTVTALITNPSTIAGFSGLYALRASDQALLHGLRRTLSESVIGVKEDQLPAAGKTLTQIVSGLSYIQRGAPRLYEAAVNRAKISLPARRRLEPVEIPKADEAPSVEKLVKLIHDFGLMYVEASEEEIETRIQAILQVFLIQRTYLSEGDWATLENAAQSPLEFHFIKFIHTSRPLSPTHWNNFCKSASGRPQNPTITRRIGEVVIQEKGNVVLSKPIAGVLNGGVGVFFNGEIIEVANANGIEDIQAQVRSIDVEIPLTVWPEYPIAEDDHEFALKNRKQDWSNDGKKYVIVRQPTGSYAARIGAEHHYQMISPGDVFVAGGFLHINLADSFTLDGDTVRFQHFMNDDFFNRRLEIARRVIAPVVYSDSPSKRITVERG